jgi:hypothetical protein
MRCTRVRAAWLWLVRRPRAMPSLYIILCHKFFVRTILDIEPEFFVLVIDALWCVIDDVSDLVSSESVSDLASVMESCLHVITDLTKIRQFAIAFMHSKQHALIRLEMWATKHDNHDKAEMCGDTHYSVGLCCLSRIVCNIAGHVVPQLDLTGLGHMVNRQIERLRKRSREIDVSYAISKFVITANHLICSHPKVAMELMDSTFCSALKDTWDQLPTL